MKDVGNYLVSEVKNMEGKIITIGLDIDKVFKAIEKNTNIVKCMTLNSTLYETSDIKRLIRKNKTLSASKLRKKFKKKKHSNLVINIRHIENNIKTVIRDSIYITSKTIYIYGKKEDFDIEVLKKRYKRYKTVITYNEYNLSYVMKIDVTEAKNNKILDIFYFISDTLYNALELFSDFLVG